MKIFMHIRDKTYTVGIGAGQQAVEWLANVALLRFDRSDFDHISCRGLKYLDRIVNMEGPIATQMQPDSPCYLLLEGDQGFDDNLGDEPERNECFFEFCFFSKFTHHSEHLLCVLESTVN
jgi:hypothetical protein